MPNGASEITLEKGEAREIQQFLSDDYMALNMNLEPSNFGSFFDIDLIKIWKENTLVVNLIKESGEKEDYSFSNFYSYL